MYVVIAGGGKVGEFLAIEMLKSGHDVAIIEMDCETADRLSVRLQGNCMVIHGDACDSRYLEDAGIRRADVFVAAIGQDDTNLVSCEISKKVFNVDRAIARVNSPKNERIFRETGIECVSATAHIVRMIEDEMMEGSVSSVSSLVHNNVSLNEITVPRMRHHSNLRGVRVSDIGLPEGSLVVAVVAGGEVHIASDRTLLKPDNIAVVAAHNDVMKEVRAAFRAL